MGQINTLDEKLPDSVEDVHVDVVRQVRAFTELAFITHEEFIKSIAHLNNLLEKYLDSNGKQLVFAIKKDSDNNLLWKTSVRIGCVKIDPETRKIDSYRYLTLNQYLRLFHGLEWQLSAIKKKPDGEDATTSSSDVLSSSLLEKVNLAVEESEHETSGADCCICMERKPEVLLPCAHCYCLPCIEQWNVNHKTCPLCRETLISTEDTWVLSEAPDAAEIRHEINSTLNNVDDSQSD